MIRTLLAVTLLATPLFAADPAPPEGFRALFNGKDLTGWYGLNPHSVVKLQGEKKEAALKKMREGAPAADAGVEEDVKEEIEIDVSDIFPGAAEEETAADTIETVGE